MSRKVKTPRRTRGRAWVALVLVAFVAVSAAVIWRRGYGVAHAVELRRLDRERVQLQAQRTALERRLHDLMSRERLAPVAEGQLGMRVPADSQVVVMPTTTQAGAMSAAPTDHRSLPTRGERAAP